MKYSALLALILGGALTLAAADTASSKTQSGRLSTASLLATQRISGKGAPDGMKETRDFLVAGESYQEKTKAELGKVIEPSTVFDSAEGFFAKQPGARHLAPDDIKGAYILTVAIGGAKIEAGAKGEITLRVGFDKEVEPLTFRFGAPPERPTPPKS